jgi:hypothetical protein
MLFLIQMQSMLNLIYHTVLFLTRFMLRSAMAAILLFVDIASASTLSKHTCQHVFRLIVRQMFLSKLMDKSHATGVDALSVRRKKGKERNNNLRQCGSFLDGQSGAQFRESHPVNLCDQHPGALIWGWRHCRHRRARRQILLATLFFILELEWMMR